MKKLNCLKFLVLLFATTLLLSSCNDDDDDEFTAYSDAVFIKKKIDGQTKVATNYYAYSINGIESVKVKTPYNNIIELDKYQNSSISFWKEAADSTYTTGIPAEGIGTYNFEVIGKDGDTLNVKDVQAFDNISIPEIDSMSYTSSKGLYVHWDSIIGADSYVLKMFDTNENLIFTGIELKASYPYSYLLYGNSSWGSWESSPENDKSYVLRIYGRVYDSNATSSDYAYNVQEISISDSTITWPTN